MTTDNQPQVPSSPPSADAVLTTGTLTLIAIGVVLALLLIWWGARLKRQRKAAEREVLERQDDRHEAPDGDAAATSPAPIAAPTTAAIPRAAPPPAPTSRESRETQVPAAPPLATAPASIAEEPTADTPQAASGLANDLTLLKGVGPKLATRLAELGIASFAQLAALSPADADALDAQLGSFQGRMARDRWIDQARYLAADDRSGFEAEFGKL